MLIIDSNNASTYHTACIILFDTCLNTADECSTIADCVEISACVNSADGFICVCPSGFMGDGRMSGSGCFLDECSSTSDCVENATCINSLDGFVCLCPPDLTGDGRMSGTGCNGWLITT